MAIRIPLNNSGGFGKGRLLQPAAKVFNMSPRMEMPRPERFSAKWAALLLVCLAVSLFLLIYPIYVIRPFRHQGATELRVALAVMGFRPIVMAAAVALAVIATVQYWRARTGRWRRALAALATVATLAFAALSRINIFELMFHPAGRPDFIVANTATLNGAEKVLAIRIGDEARAYPIRSISYHHVVNDRLGGVPIVATY
jgi:Protein of unknown function (DUF3179)